MTTRARWLGASATVILLAMVGCHLALGLEVPTGTEPTPFSPPPAMDASTDVVTEAAPLPPDPCAPAAPPAPPEKDDAPGKTVPASYFVLRDQDFSYPDGGLAGLNLDGLRTCAERDTWAKTTAACPSSNADAAACDLTSCGEDNNLGVLSARTGVNFLRRTMPLVDEGREALLAYIDNYNGEANDSSVRVGFVRAVGIVSDIGCDGAPRGAPPSGTSVQIFDAEDGGARNLYPSAYDGCDRWQLNKDDATMVLEQPIPVRLTAAYVTNYVLVTAPATVAPLATGNTAIDVTTPIFRARISTDGDAGAQNGLRLTDMVFAGRMPIAQLIPFFGTYEVRPGTPLCKQSPAYKVVAKELCRVADITQAPAFDGQGTACDSVSVGIFTSQATRVKPTLDWTGLSLQNPTPCTSNELLRADFCNNP
jgi:hypothetical protein